MKTTKFVLLLLASLFVELLPVSAQDMPSAGNLARIMQQLSKKRPTIVVFDGGRQPVNAKCPLAKFNVTLTEGPRSFSYRILSEPVAQNPVHKNILATIKRLKIDADGSPRAYHPLDPLGAGSCTLQVGDGGYYFPGPGQVCAIDQLSDGSIVVFKGTKELRDHDLTADWSEFWSQIRDRKLKSVDLEKASGQSLGYSYYLFYWKQKDMTVVFKDENVQRTVDGYPCTRGSNSRYPGYFVAGTTLKNSRDVPGAEIRPADAIAPSECSPLRNIDAETVPYFVIPGGALGQATIGDIVVVQVDSGLEMRTVYAVAADAGPITHFGEGSVALSQALAGKRQPVVNNHALNRLEIDDRIVTVLILGGTKSLLKNDYSQSNLEAVGEAELKHWAGEGIDANELLKACAAAATPN